MKTERKQLIMLVIGVVLYIAAIVTLNSLWIIASIAIFSYAAYLEM